MMMKWGRKKSSQSPPSSSPRPSFVSHAFPMSWLSRFKNSKGSSEPHVAVEKGKGKKKSGSPSVLSGDGWNGGRFYGREGDSYWSLSFRKERLRGEKINGGLKPVWYDSDDECHALPARAMKATRGDETLKLNNLKARELEALQRNFGCKAKVESRKSGLNARKKREVEDQNSRKIHRRIWEEQLIEKETARGSLDSTKLVEIIPERIIQAKNKDHQKPTFRVPRRSRGSISFSNSIDLRTIEEECVFEASTLEDSAFSEENSPCEWPKQKEVNFNGTMLGSENRPAWVHLSKETLRRRAKQRHKVKAYSPRSAAKVECKIKALEDMKRARKKMKKMTEEQAGKDTTNFNSFAIVKCSENPREDFRDSMMEMIKEKGIRQPEELEDLLACYLTLNCDEYHDLIVKVFREVWFELNEAEFYQELELLHC